MVRFLLHRFLPLLSALIISLLPACVSQDVSVVRNVYVTEEVATSLLPPDDLESAIDEYSIFSGAFNGRNMTMPTYLHADEDGVSLTFFSTLGQVLLSISYDGESVETSSSFIAPGSIVGEYVIFDIQLLYYDFSKLGSALSPNGLRFKMHEDDGGYERELYMGERLLWKGSISSGSISVENYVWKYSYMIGGAE